MAVSSFVSSNKNIYVSISLGLCENHTFNCPSLIKETKSFITRVNALPVIVLGLAYKAAAQFPVIERGRHPILQPRS